MLPARRGPVRCHDDQLSVATHFDIKSFIVATKAEKLIVREAEIPDIQDEVNLSVEVG